MWRRCLSKMFKKQYVREETFNDIGEWVIILVKEAILIENELNPTSRTYLTVRFRKKVKEVFLF